MVGRLHEHFLNDISKLQYVAQSLKWTLAMDTYLHTGSAFSVLYDKGFRGFVSKKIKNIIDRDLFWSTGLR